jgi:hypothetical protein
MHLKPSLTEERLDLDILGTDRLSLRKDKAIYQRAFAFLEWGSRVTLSHPIQKFLTKE